MADRVAVSATSDGARLRLRVKPGARRTRLCGPYGGTLKLEVASPPERGKANAAVVALLASTLGLDRARVRVVVGTTSQDKLVELLGADPATVAAALEAAGVPCAAEPAAAVEG